ncbi:MAG: ATP-binding protein [Oscillospiraceae bacterium]|nr:ATP-binding protein [Oscillospiraceae bacterium]
MKEFINREDELNFLNKEFNREGSSFIVIYGRRRIGKTSLIEKFVKDKTYIYFLASEESEYQNMNAFKKIVAETLNNELLLETKLYNWDILFKILSQSITKERLILIIDEFQYLSKINAAFPSIFQRIWDTLLKDKNIMVILCGSLIHMMESQTLSYSSPLYGRRTGQIKLKQIEFKHYHKFFTNLKYKDLIEFYSVTGGVPKYIEMFDDRLNLFSQIEQNILNKQSFLFEEPIFLLQNEVNEIGSYFSIIKSIAQGNHKLGNMSTDLEIKQTNLTKYLKTLINLDILEREVPVTEKNPEKSKMGLYKIKDNFLNFWFKFIYPEKSKLELSEKKYVLEKIKQNFIDNHVSYVYESICMSEMWSLSEKINFDKIGRWWNGNTEIDIVGLDNTGDNIIFGECKYREQPMDIDVFYDLLNKKEQVIWNNKTRREKYILFSISGFTDRLKELAESRDDLILFKKT